MSRAARSSTSTRAAIIFDREQPRDLPLIVAALPIFSKAYYATHDFTKSTLEPPLGSGPYKVGPLQPGRYISYVSARRLLGEGSAGQPRPLQFRRGPLSNISATAPPSFEALRRAPIDLREEFTSQDWATGYDFTAVKDGA